MAGIVQGQGSLRHHDFISMSLYSYDHSTALDQSALGKSLRGREEHLGLIAVYLFIIKCMQAAQRLISTGLRDFITR